MNVEGWGNPRVNGPPREAGKTTHNGLLKAIVVN